jgi:hypothetical protein
MNLGKITVLWKSAWHELDQSIAVGELDYNKQLILIYT